MGGAEKVDFRANGEVGFKAIRSFCTEFSETFLLLIHPRLALAKRNGVPLELFEQKPPKGGTPCYR